MSNQDRNARVFLTGATGFTGLYLGNELNRLGYKVLGVGLMSEGFKSKQFEINYCDLTSQEDVRNKIEKFRPDHIIHLAGISYADEDNSLAYFDVHVGATLNLLNAISPKNIGKLIIASTGQVYGPIVTDKPISESLCPNPNNGYSISKLAMEHCIRASELSDKVIIVRPFNYTGPGQSKRFIIPKLVAHFKSDESTIALGNTGVRRDFSAVSDVVDAYIKLLESNISGKTFNICSGTSYSISEILGYISEKTGKEMAIKKSPELVRKNETKVMLGSNKLISSCINWTPKKTLYNVIDEMLESDLV